MGLVVEDGCFEIWVVVLMVMVMVTAWKEKEISLCYVLLVCCFERAFAFDSLFRGVPGSCAAF